MRKIVQKSIIYECEYCNWPYGDKELALECEAQEPKRFSGNVFRPFDDATWKVGDYVMVHIPDTGEASIAKIVGERVVQHQIHPVFDFIGEELQVDDSGDFYIIVISKDMLKMLKELE